MVAESISKYHKVSEAEVLQQKTEVGKSRFRTYLWDVERQRAYFVQENQVQTAQCKGYYHVLYSST